MKENTELEFQKMLETVRKELQRNTVNKQTLNTDDFLLLYMKEVIMEQIPENENTSNTNNKVW